jgi:Terminase small subunit
VPPLSNIRHEAFCQGVANKLLSATEAYRQAGYAPKDADVNGPALMGKHGIKERIKELRAESYELSKMSKAEALALLAEIARTPAGEVNPSDKICQSVKRTEGDGWSSVEIKLPGKIEAIDTLARLCGWNEADRHAFEHGFKEKQELQSVIAKLRGHGVART